jgi:hypothetical protein
MILYTTASKQAIYRHSITKKEQHLGLEQLALRTLLPQHITPDHGAPLLVGLAHMPQQSVTLELSHQLQ